MARDKITIDLMLATKQAEREIDKINRKVADMGKRMGKSFGGMGGGTDKVRALGSGLSKATVKADEFSKSLEASNARVIAFGASAGLIMGVERALKAMVTSAIKVEKAMMDVSVVMQVSTRQLDQFGKGMFRVAKETAQGFDTVAEAATELARQGLGMEKTLSRTKDALILTRLTGMNAADSVKALTAAVNSFNKEGVTSTQIVNRMAKVDAAFAVSSEDLAKSISRVGASAISAGVGMNELMAITTAVQQKTARGGAVIGNAFKTIFTRIQRSDVQKKLRDMGIASTDMQGRMLNGMKVLQNMAGGFDKLTKSQQASLAENVAGVFQVNILKAALSDLTAQTSNYKGALDAANSATNEAYVRNEQLNQTLDSLTNRTLANLTKAGSTIGGATLEPAIRKVLNSVNTVIDSFSEGGRFESLGSTLGKGLLSGIGNFIKGPGLIIVGTAFVKLGLSLAKFAGSAFKDLMGLNAVTRQRAALEEAVIAHIASEPALLAKVRTGTLNVLAVEKDILSTVRSANAERARIQTYAAPLSTALVSRGMRAGSRGATMPGKAEGFVPNFASPVGERAAAAAGGYRAGSIKTMNQPGAGTMMYNSAETVKKFPGMSQSAIMPPQGSPAGAGYKSAFGAAHGFNPYAGRGFVPNFAAYKPFGKQKLSKDEKVIQADKTGKLRGGGVVNLDIAIPNMRNDVGVITEKGKAHTPISFSQNAMLAKGGIPGLKNEMKNWVGADGRKVGNAQLRLSGIPVVPVFPFSDKDSKTMNATGETRHSFESPLLRKALTEYSTTLSKKMFRSGASPSRDFNMKNLGEGTAGDIFEEGVRAAVGGLGNEDKQAAFDFNGSKFATSHLIGFFNRRGATNLGSKSKIESKIGPEAAKSGNIPNKMMRDPSVGATQSEVLAEFKAMFKSLTAVEGKKASFGPRKGKALGFVPNFSPLTSAIGREMQAGVPASAIRVGSSPSLRGAGNPGGVGVYNTIHEPGGLSQGISRSKSMGVNPRAHGAAGGFVPNFNDDSVMGSVGRSYHRDLEGFANEGGKAVEKGGEAIERSSAKDAKTAKINATSADKMQRAGNGLMMASIAVSMAGPAVGSALSGGTASGEAAGAGISNMLSMAMMGATTGAMMGSPTGPGALVSGAIGGVAGLGLGALGMDWGTAFGEKGEKADAQQSLDQAKALSEGIGAVKKALEEMSNLEYLTVGERMMKFVKIQEKFLKAEAELMAGGEDTEGVRRDFRANKEIQAFRAGNFSNMGPEAFDKIDRALEKVMNEAEAVTTSGSQSDFQAKMRQVLDASVTVRSKSDREKKLSHPDYVPDTFLGMSAEGHRGLLPEVREDLAKSRAGMGEKMLKAFTGPVQERMATGSVMVGQHKVPGEAIIQNYASEMQKKNPDVRKALSGGIIPLMRDSGAGKMADALEEMIGQQGKELGGKASPFEDAGAYSDEELNQMAKGVLNLKTRSSGKGFSRSAGAGVFHMMDFGRTSGQLGMFQPGFYGDQKKTPLPDPLLANILETERSNSILSLYDPIQQAGVRGRGFGFQLQSNIAGRRRGLELGRSGRTRQAQLAGATGMFGNALFEETGRLNRIGAFDALEAAQRDISDTERLSVAGKKETAAATYLKTLQDKAISNDAREAAINKLPLLQAMTPDQRDTERSNLRASETYNKTEVGQAQIALLTTVIDAEIKARETAVHKGNEAIASYDKQNKEIDENVVHLKKMKEAARHFYEGDFIDKLKDQRSKLGERIKFEERQVEAGKQNILVLQESKMEFEELNEKIDGTGDKLGLLKERFQQILNLPMTPKEKKDAGVAAVDRFNNLLVSRREGAEGASKVLPLAQASFKAGRISADELRAIKSQIRLDTPGSKGNPMEAFKDQFLYGGRDAMSELEGGMISVADTMKSSFSNAFQNIANGSMSAGSAIAQMADGILKSISSMTADMATNMMFAKMFPGKSQGGPISKFNSGGIVTGGSGYRDDVPAMMNGGEFVIKKSSAQKIGYGALNAINSGSAAGYAKGGSTKGPGMGSMFAVSAGASALSGLLNQSGKGSKKKPWRGKDYGFGRGKHGYFGGPDADAGGTSSFSGGSNAAQVSLNKAYVYYRRDPKTGRLISEKARPTEGRYEVSSALSLAGRLGEGDPQTARMSGKETKMGSYSDYIFSETARRKAVIKAHEKQKRGRLVSAYMNAAMLMGGSYLMGKTSPAVDSFAGLGPNPTADTSIPTDYGVTLGPLMDEEKYNIMRKSGQQTFKGKAGGGSVGASPAMLTGGEYVMGADTVRQYGLGFMGELNRGNVSGMAAGGPVGGFTGGGVGSVNNNVSVNVNIDKRGNADVSSSPETSTDNTSSENSTAEAKKNKDLGIALQTVVLQEIMKQQRPGGLLRG